MEIDHFLLSQKPVDRSARWERRRGLTQMERDRLGRFDEEYFDGPTGYGGYHYDGRYASAAAGMVEFYRLDERSRILDVGCAKGFVLYEFVKLGMATVRGCDISVYAAAHCHPGVVNRIDVMSAHRLGYRDGWFDLVLSVDALHNLSPGACDDALAEMQRVSRGACFVQVASFESAEEETRLREWGVTVQTFRSKRCWRGAFARTGYKGDYSFKTF